MAKRIASISEEDCVACGCCVKVCPKEAISIRRGINAIIDRNKCIGCGKCVKECPASIIELAGSVN
jgi:Fe-S-cluster-containing hydrogenase component 2